MEEKIKRERKYIGIRDIICLTEQVLLKSDM